MNITVIQPQYRCGAEPDKRIREFIYGQLDECPRDGIIVLPEYSNAGGLSRAEDEIKAMQYAGEMLDRSREFAIKKNSTVCVNVLEKREEKVRNSTYLIDRSGEVRFVYNKQHLPLAEVRLGVKSDEVCSCTTVLDNIRFAFLTCYDVYFFEQIEHIARFKPDVIIVPGYQRGERVDILRAQSKLIAFRCNAYLARALYSMDSDERGGCSMIVAPDGNIIEDLGKSIGTATAEADLSFKYMRAAGFGEGLIRNDDFINYGLRPDAFK